MHMILNLATYVECTHSTRLPFLSLVSRFFLPNVANQDLARLRDNILHLSCCVFPAVEFLIMSQMICTRTAGSSNNQRSFGFARNDSYNTPAAAPEWIQRSYSGRIAKRRSVCKIKTSGFPPCAEDWRKADGFSPDGDTVGAQFGCGAEGNG